MSEDFRQPELTDRRGFKRSPVTLPEYRRGRPAANKGRKFPAEVITKSEYRALLGSFAPTATGVRNRAMVMLMYAGLKVWQVRALERRHYEPGSATLTLPASRFHPERELTLDAETRAALDRWMELRRKAPVRVSAPLFCTVNGPSKGQDVNAAYVREFVREHAEAVGIDRRVNPQGLLRSGNEHRAQTHGRLMEQLVGSVDEVELESRYRSAFETWEAAIGLFGLDPIHHARRIGEDCRAALASFAETALTRYGVEPPSDPGTVPKLRALLSAVGPDSHAVSAHHDALISYWRTVSNLDQRQAHEANREKETLTREDARRAILYTLLVMVEVDRALPLKPR
jgi:hypothetical protein